MSYCKIEVEYPEAEDGEKRITFVLDPVDPEFEENNCRLQLIPGRTVEMSKAEAFNNHILGGEVQELALETGHTCYKVSLQEHMASTRMMMMMPTDEDDGEKVKRFVPMANAPVYRYTSKFPVVVYIPENADLRYSVWTGSEMMSAVPE